MWSLASLMTDIAASLLPDGKKWPCVNLIKWGASENASYKDPLEPRTKGSIIRSRARWYELGGKCNKYFFNLEKRSYEKRHITKLKTPEGITAEDPKVILTVMKNF